jgi:DNA-3-methyladenine glycosylase I
LENDLKRCPWCGEAPDYQHYHDHEWGVPLADDRRLFEKMVLEGFQSGLSWITILRKRENFRAAFASFDFNQVAQFDANDIERLVQDAGIVRHRGKIEAAIQNARCTVELVRERGALAPFIWQFEPKRHPVLHELSQAQAQILESQALSAALKARGYKFVGPTTMYALMQSAGLVNDHLAHCHRFDQVQQLRSEFDRPHD